VADIIALVPHERLINWLLNVLIIRKSSLIKLLVRLNWVRIVVNHRFSLRNYLLLLVDDMLWWWSHLIEVWMHVAIIRRIRSLLASNWLLR
jgi:hypothetical protein